MDEAMPCYADKKLDLHAGISSMIGLFPGGPPQVNPLPDGFEAHLGPPRAWVVALDPLVEAELGAVQLNSCSCLRHPEGQKCLLDLLQACKCLNKWTFRGTVMA